MKKYWIIPLSLLAAAALCYLLWSGSGVFLSQREQIKAEVPGEVKFLSSAPPLIGSLVPYKAEFKVPGYREITQFSMTPGKGTVIAHPLTVKKIKSFWKYNIWQLSGDLCCVRAGNSEPGSVNLELSPKAKNGTPEKFTLKIPALKIGELAASTVTAPELAQTVPLPGKSISKLHLLWLLLLLLPLLYLLFKRRKRALPPLSLRRRTLNALDSLRGDVYARRLSAKEGIAGVSDLLRNYLEERYALPASGKTTPEFLAEMEFTSAVPSQAGSFLRNFLNAADMIKFAQAPCDTSAVSTAVNSAVELVENTSEPEKEEK